MPTSEQGAKEKERAINKSLILKDTKQIQMILKEKRNIL